MNIFSGRGKLIPIIAILGGAVGVFLSFNLASMSKSSPIATGCLGAAVLLVLFGFTFGRATQQTSIDPRTNRQVTARLRHTFFFLNATLWGIAAGVCFFVFAARNLVSQVDFSKPYPRSAFSTADDLLIGKSKGVVHGNTQEAEEMAKQFSVQLKRARSEGIEGRKSAPVFTTTGGEFLTYCLLTPKRCAFLVHVPDLRKFSSGAKDFIAEAAWLSAVSLTKDKVGDRQILAVGIRGSLLYDRVLAGLPGEGSSAPEAASGNDESRDFLMDLFQAAEREMKPETDTAEPLDKLKGPSNDEDGKGPSVPAKSSPPSATVEQPAASAALTQSTKPKEPAPQAPIARMRDWKDADGKPLRAALVRFMDEERKEAEFQREDGQTFVIPVERFSNADRAYLLGLPGF